MCEITVLSWAVGGSVGRLEFGAILAVDVEGEVASATDAAVDSQIGEHQTIGAEFLTEDKVFALVVAIALDGVGENAVLFRTIAVSLLSVD